MRVSKFIAALIVVLLPSVAAPQSAEFPLYGNESAVASLNRERLLLESAYGNSMSAELAKLQASLVEENNRLLNDLEEEERSLTETRKTMDPAAFAPLAAAFDAKANSIRAQQEAKALDLAKALEAARLRFFQEVEPVILDVMRAEGVSILLNEQSVMISLEGADLTNAVLAKLDQLFADGQIGQDR